MGNDDHNKMNRSLSDCFFNVMPASFLRPEVTSVNTSFVSSFEFALLPVLVDLLEITVNCLPSKHGEYCFLPI